MAYRHCCVIDAAGNFVDFVLVWKTEEKEEIQDYILKKGEKIIQASPPEKRMEAGESGFIKPHWNGSEWEEGASLEEAEQWEKENPKKEIAILEPTISMLMEKLEMQEQSSLNQEEMLLNQQILLCNMELDLDTIVTQFYS